MYRLFGQCCANLGIWGLVRLLVLFLVRVLILGLGVVGRREGEGKSCQRRNKRCAGILLEFSGIPSSPGESMSAGTFGLGNEESG